MEVVERLPVASVVQNMRRFAMKETCLKMKLTRSSTKWSNSRLIYR